MRPILYSSRVCNDSIELTKILKRTKNIDKVDIKYLNEDYTYLELPVTVDFEGIVGKYTPTLKSKELSYGFITDILAELKEQTIKQWSK